MPHITDRCTPPACGKPIFASQPGVDCRIRDRGPVSTFEEDQAAAPRDAGTSEHPSSRVPWLVGLRDRRSPFYASAARTPHRKVSPDTP
jgi:hypothetical protein